MSKNPSKKKPANKKPVKSHKDAGKMPAFPDNVHQNGNGLNGHAASGVALPPVPSRNEVEGEQCPCCGPQGCATAGVASDPNALERFSKIEATLLAIGGQRVVRQDISFYAEGLCEVGELIDLPVKMRPGDRNRCHWNATRIWAEDIDGPSIAVGYGLGADGLWRVHSWLVDDEHIYETTVELDKYWGVLLTAEGATPMWLRYYVKEAYPRPMSILLPCDCENCVDDLLHIHEVRARMSQLVEKFGLRQDELRQKATSIA